MRFNPSFSLVKWDPPLSAGVPINNILYHLIVTNTNIDAVVVNTTTTKMNYSLRQIGFCVNYTVIVTPLAPNHHGDSVKTVFRTPGGELLIT